jgi:hypothetical protein
MKRKTAAVFLLIVNLAAVFAQDSTLRMSV